MKEKNIQTFKKVTAVTISLTAVLTLGAAMAYLTFREKSTANILNSFPSSNSIISGARLLFALNLIATYPLALYVSRDTLEKSIFANQPYNKTRHIGLTVFLISTTTILACLTCDLGVLIEIIGGVSSSMLAFTVPSACWIRCNKLEKTPLKFRDALVHWTLIVFGVLLMIFTVGFTAYKQAGRMGAAKECRW